MHNVFVVGGCALAGLIGGFLLWTGYGHLLWKYSQHVFMKNIVNVVIEPLTEERSSKS